MRKRVKDAEGVTEQLASYVSVESGPLLHRKADVEQRFWDRVATDASLQECPRPQQVDPELWEVMTGALLHPMVDAAADRVEKARRLVGEVREAKRLCDQRIRSRRSRDKKKQVCMCGQRVCAVATLCRVKV